ncbi:MAG: hypothetical protein C0501_24260 [Isosphaera sp.]|nr:hypothetical protein [Isosphaera sp.]
MTVRVQPTPLALVGSPPPTARQTAVWLLGQGLWPVVVRPGGKAPLGRGWGLIRPSPDALEAAFRRSPRAGVGLLLGPEGGVVDLEVDDPAAAEPALAELFPDGLPATAGWDSPRGRHHLFLWHPALARRPAVVTLAGGALEFRAGGAGKQVMSVCPPTANRSGGRRRWVGEGRILPLPGVLLSSVGRPASTRFRRGAPLRPPDGVVGRELARVRSAVPGTRNATLNRAAFVLGLLAGSGRVCRETVGAELANAAGACGLPESEAVRTIARALDAGVRKAASVPF